MITWTLATKPDGPTDCVGVFDELGDGSLHGLITFIEEMGQLIRIPVDS